MVCGKFARTRATQMKNQLKQFYFKQDMIQDIYYLHWNIIHKSTEMWANKSSLGFQGEVK